MHQKRLAAGLCPDPLGSLQRSPDPVSVFKRYRSIGTREGKGGRQGAGKGGDMGKS